MLNSPVVVLSSGEDKKARIISSPTSTADDFMDCEVSKMAGVESTVDRLTASSSIVVPSTLSQRNAVKKNKPLVLKTILNTDVRILKPFSMVLDLKMDLCANTPIDKNDLLIVKNGKELRNSDELSVEDLQTKAWIMLRTTCSTSVPISLKPQGIEGGVNKTLKVPLNMRVFQLKKQFFKSKFTTLKPESQRIIVCGKVLHDSCMVGDYLLSSILNNKTSTAEGSSSSSITLNSEGKPVVHPVATLYLSKTINLKHEVDVEIPLTNGSVITCSIELSQPLSMLPQLLHRRHFFPLPNEDFFYVFSLKVPRTSTLADVQASGSLPFRNMKKSIANESNNQHSYELVELDLNKTLLDYGFTPSTKKVSVEIAKSHHIKMEDTRPTEFSDMLFIYLLTMAQRRVKRIEQGLPAEEPLGHVQMDLPIPLRIPINPLPFSSGRGGSARRSQGGAVVSHSHSSVDDDNRPPTAAEMREMLQAMGMNAEVVNSMMSNQEFVGAVAGSNITTTTKPSSVSSGKGSAVVSKKRSSPDTSCSSSVSSQSDTSTTSSSSKVSPTNKKTSTNNSNNNNNNTANKGGLFGGLKKGFLSGGNKKDAK